ncbi:LysR family transcriptional regulator [Pseudomonas sp. NA-150]|uniref:LysR family transcriptional regulator n=1 Tax=Pseudomonas sp. NA-150 TaxID=3367525 RepID=UPI0037CC8C04
MSADPGTPTLDQLRAFLTVVETGSFAGAARKLYRATSVVSYAIANLESQLGVQLFDRKTTRKPQLTQAGRTVLVEARTVFNGVDGLRAKVKGLMQGLEAEIRLTLDVMLPASRVADALKAFSLAFPTVTLRLQIEALGAIAQSVLDGESTLGVSSPYHTEVSGIERIGIGSIALIPVASPDHPLALGNPNPPGAAREHVQLVLSDRSQLTRDRDYAVVSPRTWRLADLGAKHMLLREGIGWGNMPVDRVEDDLASGRLVQLDLPEIRSQPYTFDVIYRTDTPPGPAARWLIERFVQQAS